MNKLSLSAFGEKKGINDSYTFISSTFHKYDFVYKISYKNMHKVSRSVWKLRGASLIN